MPDQKPEDVLHPNGLFNPLYRFAFTNVTSEDFTSYWNGKPMVIPKGATVKLNHHLAVKLTKEMVDRLIIGDAKAEEDAHYKNNPNAAPNTFRSPKGLSLGVPAIRKLYEDKVCKQLPTESDSIQLEMMRNEMEEGLRADLSKEVSREPVPVPVATLSGSDDPTKLPEQFAEL